MTNTYISTNPTKKNVSGFSTESEGFQTNMLRELYGHDRTVWKLQVN